MACPQANDDRKQDRYGQQNLPREPAPETPIDVVQFAQDMQQPEEDKAQR